MAGELIGLLTHEDPKMYVKVMRAVEKTITDSFTEDGSSQTQDEVRRRFKLLEVAIRDLRGEYGWAFVRIIDALPTALRSKLDGIPWNPSTQHAVWAP